MKIGKITFLGRQYVEIVAIANELFLLIATRGCEKLLTLYTLIFKNIAGILPENSRNSFVDLQSQKTVKKTDQKIVFSLKADMLHFD